MQKLGRFVVLFVFTALTGRAIACEDIVDNLEYVDTDVGFWDSVFDGGYVRSAWIQLGEELDSRDELDDEQVVMVHWQYEAGIWIFSGRRIFSSLCIYRDPGQTWEDATTETVDGGASPEADSESDEDNEDGDDAFLELDNGEFDDWLADLEDDDWPSDWSVEIEDFYDEEEWDEEEEL